MSNVALVEQYVELVVIDSMMNIIKQSINRLDKRYMITGGSVFDYHSSLVYLKGRIITDMNKSKKTNE